MKGRMLAFFLVVGIFSVILLQIRLFRESVHVDQLPHFAKPVAEKTYAVLTSTYAEIAAKDSPRKALLQLQIDIPHDPSLARVCHGIAHTLGREAFKKYGTFARAMSFSQEVCNSGYMHGVTESLFSSDKAIEEKMVSLCKFTRPLSYDHWECVHGIGHGLMYMTNNNLPLSLKKCEAFRSGDRHNCVNGVFMENFNSDTSFHPSKYLSKENVFGLCANQANDFKSHCYYYAPTYYLSLHRNDYVSLFNRCLELSEHTQDCIGGTTGQAVKDNFQNPLVVEKLCNMLTSSKATCISGMVSMYINMTASLKEGRELCEKLERKNQKNCFAVIQRRSIEFASI